MRKSTVIAIPFIDLLVVVALSGTLAAWGKRQDVAPPGSTSLEEQLQAQYRPVKMGKDSSGTVVLEAGTVLSIQKGGVMGLPPGNTTKGCTSTYGNGDLKPPGRGCTEGRKLATTLGSWGRNRLTGKAADAANSVNTDTASTRFFNLGEKVYPSTISVYAEHDTIAFAVVACDTCNGTSPATYYKAEVDFHFPKGLLAASDVSKIEDIIGEVFAIDTNSNVSGNSNSAPQDPSAQGGGQAQQTPPQQQAQGAGQSQDQEQSPPAQAPNPPVQ